MKRVLILGRSGMLGDAVWKHLAVQDSYELRTVSERWPGRSFEDAVISSSPDAIINCIGKIPQRHPTDEEYRETNIALPVFLDSLGIPVVHPSTDCEFKGSLPEGSFYTKASVRDADDTYGISKAEISKKIENEFSHTKILRTSIIGHEPASSVSLLDWFLSAEGAVKGFTNHYWNGVTTLTWATLAQDLIEHWDSYPVLNQHGTQEAASKYGVLQIIRRVYGKDITIEPFETPETMNKCLLPDRTLPDLEEQLAALKAFYGR